MKTENILLVAIPFVLGGSYLYAQTQKNKADETLPDELYPEVKPNPTPGNNQNLPSPGLPATLNNDSKFTKADKAHVAIMQKMLGVGADGVWGSDTETALNKLAPNILKPFSLNQLQNYILQVKNIGSFKKGDAVYAKVSFVVEITKLRTKEVYKKTVSKGQYLGVIQTVRNATYIVLNNFAETLVVSPTLISKSSLGNPGQPVSNSNSVSML